MNLRLDIACNIQRESGFLDRLHDLNPGWAKRTLSSDVTQREHGQDMGKETTQTSLQACRIQINRRTLGAPATADSLSLSPVSAVSALMLNTQDPTIAANNVCLSVKGVRNFSSRNHLVEGLPFSLDSSATLRSSLLHQSCPHGQPPSFGESSTHNLSGKSRSANFSGLAMAQWSKLPVEYTWLHCRSTNGRCLELEMLLCQVFGWLPGLGV